MYQMFRLIRISGSDASQFLQGQLTQDVGKLAEHAALLSAWCNPQGRVISLMRLLAAGNAAENTSEAGAIGLVVPAALAETLVKRLLLYRLRAAVDIEIAGAGWAACAVLEEQKFAALAALGLLPAQESNAAQRSGGLTAIDTGAKPRCIELYGPLSSMEELGLVDQQPHNSDSSGDWQRALINAGIPLIQPATSEKYTPHMLNLDRVGAVSFNKGCYTGQEIVARTQHLGSSKRRLMHFRTDQGDTAVGDKLRHEERDVGEVVNVIGKQLLAVVPVALHNRTLSVNGRPASPVALPYSLPQSPKCS